MPISSSAKKALRVARAKTLVNRRRKEVLKTALKLVSAESLPRAFSAIDKAAKWGIIEKNKANRLKARFGKQFDSAKKAESPAPAKTAKTAKPAVKKVAKKASSKATRTKKS